jgi:hypothetical protein
MLEGKEGIGKTNFETNFNFNASKKTVFYRFRRGVFKRQDPNFRRVSK